MRRIERQITIDAPAAKVFSYLADFPRHGEWAEATHRLQIQQTSPPDVLVLKDAESSSWRSAMEWLPEIHIEGAEVVDTGQASTS